MNCKSTNLLIEIIYHKLTKSTLDRLKKGNQGFEIVFEFVETHPSTAISTTKMLGTFSNLSKSRIQILSFLQIIFKQ